MIMDENSFGAYHKKFREKRGYSINKLSQKSGVSAAHISRLESEKRPAPAPEIIEKLAKALDANYEEMMRAAGYLPQTIKEETSLYQIEQALYDDPELKQFWEEMLRRDDLQIMLKQVKDLSPEAIRRIIKYIKMVEDEESQES